MQDKKTGFDEADLARRCQTGKAACGRRYAGMIVNRRGNRRRTSDNRPYQGDQIGMLATK